MTALPSLVVTLPSHFSNDCSPFCSKNFSQMYTFVRYKLHFSNPWRVNQYIWIFYMLLASYFGDRCLGWISYPFPWWFALLSVKPADIISSLFIALWSCLNYGSFTWLLRAFLSFFYGLGFLFVFLGFGLNVVSFLVILNILIFLGLFIKSVIIFDMRVVLSLLTHRKLNIIIKRYEFVLKS